MRQALTLADDYALARRTVKGVLVDPYHFLRMPSVSNTRPQEN